MLSKLALPTCTAINTAYKNMQNTGLNVHVVVYVCQASQYVLVAGCLCFSTDNPPAGALSCVCEGPYTSYSRAGLGRF
jgi:hypothetical protein